MTLEIRILCRLYQHLNEALMTNERQCFRMYRTEYITSSSHGTRVETPTTIVLWCQRACVFSRRASSSLRGVSFSLTHLDLSTTFLSIWESSLEIILVANILDTRSNQLAYQYRFQATLDAANIDSETRDPKAWNTETRESPDAICLSSCTGKEAWLLLQNYHNCSNTRT